MKNIRKLWQYSYNYKGSFILLVLFVCISAILQIIIPRYMSDVLDGIVAMQPMSSIVRTCIIIGVLSLMLVGQGIGQGYYNAKWSSGVTRNLADALFNRILNYESKDMDNFGAGTALTRLTTDVTNLRRALEMVASLLICPLLVIFSIISAFEINKSLSMIFVLVIPFLGAVLLFIIVRSRIHYRKMLTHYDEMNQALSENIKGMRTVKSYAREDKQKSVFWEIAGNLMRHNQSAERLAALNNPFSKMAVNISVLALAWLGGRQIIRGHLTVGELFCLISYTNQILAQMLIISMILVPLNTSQVSLGRILEMLEHKSDPRGKRNSKEPQALGETDAAVSFKNVNFSYISKDPSNPLLGDISFDIKKGEFFGITGTGGAGKTTVIKLLMGLYGQDAGDIYVLGKAPGQYPKEELRDLFSYVPQQAQLFSGTVRENLCAGITATKEEMAIACRNACITDYLDKHQEGYETILKEGGSNLSGGQKQRMCLARALLRNAPILVLDNVTSALDRITEEKVVRNLRQEYADRTRIVISDRLSTLKEASRILVMDRGKVVGLGSHDELVENCPLYREMAQTQKRQITDV